MENDIHIKIDKDIKLKASFVLKAKGKTISTAIRELFEQYAKEFDEMNK